MSGLTAEAETFLRSLEQALRPLSDADRGAVVQEIRAHLLDRAAQGPLNLMSCLEHMGRPEDMADEIIGAYREGGALFEEAVVDPRALPTTDRRSALPRIRTRPAASQLMRQLFSDFAATLRASRDEIGTPRAMLAIALIPFNCVGFVVTADDQAALGGLIQWGALGLLAVPALGIAYRAMLDPDDHVWTIDRDTLRYAGYSYLLVGAITLVALGFRSWAAGAGAQFWAVLPTLVLVALALGYVFIRLQPWLVGLALGESLALGEAWRRTGSRTSAALFAWACILAPLLLAFVIAARMPTLLSYRALVGPGLAIAAIQSVIELLIVLSIAALNVMMFRWIVGERVPTWSRFTSAAPSPDEVARVLERLKASLRSGGGRRMNPVV